MYASNTKEPKKVYEGPCQADAKLAAEGSANRQVNPNARLVFRSCLIESIAVRLET